ncbi:MAG: 6,7-dimethyl-8-ribityllumazine synthase [Acidimicrobiia bacterium]
MKVTEIDPPFDASGLRVGVAASQFNEFVTEGLLQGALEALRGAGGSEVTVVRVAGALELPLVVRALAESGHDCVIALGAVIQGETDHYEHVASQASAGLRAMAIETGVPVGFGLLTAREVEQARERSVPGPGNKGAEAAAAAVRAACAIRELRNSPQ